MSSTDRIDRLWVPLSLLVAGAILGGLVEEVLDYRRELRENTQSFVETFNSSYYGLHRDRLHIFFVDTRTVEASSGTLTRREFDDWLIQTVHDDPELSASIFATAEFYRTVGNCVEEGRCSEQSVVDAFAPYARIFYNVFYLALRNADCERGFPETEIATAKIAKLAFDNNNVCESLVPFN